MLCVLIQYYEPDPWKEEVEKHCHLQANKGIGGQSAKTLHYLLFYKRHFTYNNTLQQCYTV